MLCGETLLGPGARGGVECKAGFNARNLESYQREGFVEEDGIRHGQPLGCSRTGGGRGTWLDSVPAGNSKGRRG